VVREAGTSVSLTLPHSTGKSVRVAIASDEVIAKIQAGEIDFDVLVAHPSFMPKLAKFAPVLGPKGLMPNPKNGTLTPNPEAAQKKLEAGTVTVKTEKKAPLMHVRIGKNSMETAQLTANLETLLKTLKGKVLSMAIASSMSPGVKVVIE
jgi:large subunit ribosomal protein L1